MHFHTFYMVQSPFKNLNILMIAFSMQNISSTRNSAESTETTLTEKVFVALVLAQNPQKWINQRATAGPRTFTDCVFRH